MVLTEYLNQKQQDILNEAIERVLMQRGVNVKSTLSLIESKTKKHRGIYCETSSFQTTPVLFKKLYAYGQGQIKTLEGNNGHLYYKCILNIHYRWEHFSGGSNGQHVFALEIQFGTHNEADNARWIDIDVKREHSIGQGSCLLDGDNE